MKLADIFLTIQGEAQFAGLLTIFIRTAYCPFACAWPCDTGFTKEKHWIDVKYEMDPYGILKFIEEKGWNAKYICLTGGEPLVDAEVGGLVDRLVGAGYIVGIETSGLVRFTEFLRDGVHIIADIKCPSSKEEGKNRFQDWGSLRYGVDQLKAVIEDQSDYSYVKEKVGLYRPVCEVLLSPSWGGSVEVSMARAAQLADWVIEDQGQFRIQLQMHKYLGVA